MTIGMENVNNNSTKSGKAITAKNPKCTQPSGSQEVVSNKKRKQVSVSMADQQYDTEMVTNSQESQLTQDISDDECYLQGRTSEDENRVSSKKRPEKGTVSSI